MFERLESLFQEHKMRFIVHETFVMVAVENLLMLRTFLRDYLQTFDRESDQKAPCWPCVCVVTDRKNFNFNNDLPKKVGLKWDSLMPDFPYLSYRNAYLLGEGFTIRDIAFSGDQSSIDSWCNIILDENSVSHRSIPLLMAGHLASSGAGDTGCFYCGIRTHTAAQCPTRTYAPSRPQIWDELAALDLDTINEGFRQIEHVLVAKGLNGYGELLNTPGPTATLLQAVLDLNGAGQLRNVPRQWLYRMRTSCVYQSFATETPTAEASAPVIRTLSLDEDSVREAARRLGAKSDLSVWMLHPREFHRTPLVVKSGDNMLTAAIAKPRPQRVANEIRQRRANLGSRRRDTCDDYVLALEMQKQEAKAVEIKPSLSLLAVRLDDSSSLS